VIDIDGTPLTDITGSGADLVGLVELLDGVTEIDGGAIVVAGAELTDINGTLGRLVSREEGEGASSGKLMTGILGRTDCPLLSGPETLMVGIAGEDNGCFG
jgi:hypothetical protein